MRFWDSSAIVPMLVAEPTSGAMRALLADDLTLAAWWATPIECASAIARRERVGAVTAQAAATSLAALDALERSWSEIPPSTTLRHLARRIVRTHELRAADAFQLAAAIIAAADAPTTLPFVTLDERLALAADREGFPVLPG
ncbi:MAG: PIN domain-containing protein [Acidimicrobiia bacterium]|nr:PIN domain-containing protein [Acidimicrobiia bacterium]